MNVISASLRRYNGQKVLGDRPAKKQFRRTVAGGVGARWKVQSIWPLAVSVQIDVIIPRKHTPALLEMPN